MRYEIFLPEYPPGAQAYQLDNCHRKWYLYRHRHLQQEPIECRDSLSLMDTLETLQLWLWTQNQLQSSRSLQSPADIVASGGCSWWGCNSVLYRHGYTDDGELRWVLSCGLQWCTEILFGAFEKLGHDTHLVPWQALPPTPRRVPRQTLGRMIMNMSEKHNPK